MGRFSATFLLLLGACGDNLSVGELETPDVENPGVGGNATEQPRYVPQVCGVSSWSPKIADPSMDLSVVARPASTLSGTRLGGATLLAVPRAGGEITGFNIDDRMNIDASTTKIAIENTFSQVVVSYMNDRPVSTAVQDGAVYVHMLGANLEDPQYIAKLPGSAVGEPAFYKAQGNIVMPVVNDTGLWMYRMDDSLEPLEVKQFARTKPGRSITVSQLGTAMMTAWSTDTSCHLQVNTTYEPGVFASVESPCPSPRLAVNQGTGDAVMLFDSNDGVRMMPIHITMMGGDAPVIRADATSPRALFDGTNFWVSYIDSRGDVVVGFLDKDHHPVTMSLGAPQPERTGYELIMMDGAPHVFSVDANGYTAYRMCAEAQ